MRYSIGICLGNNIVAAAGGYIAACCLAEDRLDPQLAPLLYSDLAEYNGEQSDGCLSWIRCTEKVAAEYGVHGQRLQPVAFAEPAIFRAPTAFGLADRYRYYYIAAAVDEVTIYNGLIDYDPELAAWKEGHPAESIPPSYKAGRAKKLNAWRGQEVAL
jgi:hypothetical protein